MNRQHQSLPFGDIEGKTALVTGANSGIGNATALMLLRQGAKVFGHDLTEGEGLASLRVAGASTMVGDLADHGALQRYVGMHESPHFLVNAAGVIRFAPLAEMTSHSWDLMFDVNVKALFFLTQLVSERMVDGGAIVNLSSMAARAPKNQESGVYAATKAAVASLTRSYAYALASRNIRVNALMPGIISTPMQTQTLTAIAGSRGLSLAEYEVERMAGVPLGRAGLPEEVARAAVWLLSDESSYITGQALAVDGGVTMY